MIKKDRFISSLHVILGHIIVAVKSTFYIDNFKVNVIYLS